MAKGLAWQSAPEKQRGTLVLMSPAEARRTAAPHLAGPDPLSRMGTAVPPCALPPPCPAFLPFGERQDW